MNAQNLTLGGVIRQRRIEIGLTQEQLAERIGGGLRQSDISRLERDRIQLPRSQRMRALADALEMQPGELLALSGWQGGVLHQSTAGDGDIAINERPADSANEQTRWATFRLAEALEQSRLIQERCTAVIAQSDRTAALWLRRFGQVSEDNERV